MQREMIWINMKSVHQKANSYRQMDKTKVFFFILNFLKYILLSQSVVGFS